MSSVPIAERRGDFDINHSHDSLIFRLEGVRLALFLQAHDGQIGVSVGMPGGSALCYSIAPADLIEAARGRSLASSMAAPHQCEPQPAVTDDGFCEWVCPTPTGYLMQCCNCGLIHEAEFRVAKYEPRPSEKYEVMNDPDLQVQLRMRRADQTTATTGEKPHD